MINNGASVHVTFRRDIFSSYTLGEFGDPRLALESVLRCAGIGEVNLEMPNGTKLTLKCVKHVLNIR